MKRLSLFSKSIVLIALLCVGTGTLCAQTLYDAYLFDTWVDTNAWITLDSNAVSLIMPLPNRIRNTGRFLGDQYRVPVHLGRRGEYQVLSECLWYVAFGQHSGFGLKQWRHTAEYGGTEYAENRAFRWANGYGLLKLYALCHLRR